MIINDVQDFQVGDLGFTSIGGRVGAGVLAAQSTIDVINILRGKRTENAGWITHAYMITEVRDGLAFAVEAMPKGARRVAFGDAAPDPGTWNGGITRPHALSTLAVEDRIGPGFAYVRLPVSATTASDAAGAATGAIGTPYSFLDYASIALLHTGLPRELVRSRVEDSGRMICSQLVDWAYCSAGYHLFDDGRMPQDVTPGALFWRAAALGEVVVW